MPESLELVFRIQTEGKAQLDAIVASVKGISGELRQGNQQLGHFDGSLRKVADTAKRSADGLGQVGKAAQEGVAKPLGEAALAVDRFSLKVLALDVATRYGSQALQGLYSGTFGLVKEFGAAAQQTEKLASSLGLGVAEAERWQAITRLAGVGTNGLEAAAARVAAALQDTSGAGAKVVAVLRELGVNVNTARGETRAYGAVARDAIAALSQMEDATKRYALAQRLLGSDGAKQFQPLLAQYRELHGELDRLGLGLDEKLTKNLSRAGGEIDKLSLAWDAFRQKLAARIAPVVIPIVQVSTRAIAGGGIPGAALAGPAAGGPVPTTESYRSFPGQALDAARALFGQYGPGLGPGAAEIGRTFTEVQGRLLAAPPAGKPARIATDPRGAQFQGLLDSLEEQGLDPLAKLLADTENRLQALVAKYGGLRGEEQLAASGALQGAIRRQTARNAPIATPVDLATQGFQYGALRTLPLTADVDARQSEATLAQFTERRLRALRQYTGYQEEITRLTAGPGGERAAIERIAVLREDAAQREFAITRDRARFEEQVDQARKDRVLSLLELQRKQLEDYKNTAGQVFDALTAQGGGGLRDFFRGQASILQRQLFVNASAGIFQQLGGTLGRVGAASGLGGLLSGTIFDPANAGGRITANTTATERNTLALERNTAIAAGGGLVGQIPGLTGSTGLPAGGLDGLIRSATPSGNTTLGKVFAGLSSPLTAGLFRGFQGGDYSVVTGDGTASSASALGLTSTSARVANIGASAAIVGGGSYGILQGLRQGGARGASTAIASGLGVASTIPGPQQAFVQAAALVAGLVTGLFPDAKQERQDAIGRTLQGSRYTDAVGVDRFTDQYGREVDTNRRGEIRVSQPVTVHVQAMDAKGFLERAEDIGNAVKAALQGGHDVADSMRGLVFVR